MRTGQSAPESVDAYIAGFPEEVQAILEQIRATIKETAPGAEETISYNIPAFTLMGRYLIYFAAFKKHVSVYPAPVGNAAFEAELSPYASGRGTAKFALDEPIPFDLVARIVRFRAQENLERAKAKRQTR